MKVLVFIKKLNIKINFFYNNLESLEVLIKENESLSNLLLDKSKEIDRCIK